MTSIIRKFHIIFCGFSVHFCACNHRFIIKYVSFNIKQCIINREIVGRVIEFTSLSSNYNILLRLVHSVCMNVWLFIFVEYLRLDDSLDKRFNLLKYCFLIALLTCETKKVYNSWTNPLFTWLNVVSVTNSTQLGDCYKIITIIIL